MANFYRSLPTYAGSNFAWVSGSPASVILNNEFFGVASSGPDALNANDLVTGAVVVGNPSVAQTHNLSSVGVAAGNPVVGNPSLAITVSLSANGIVLGNPVVPSATIGQRHILTSTALITGSPALGSVTLGERHNLSATGLTTGPPVVGAASLASIHSLIAQAIETGAPEFSSVLLSQAIVLTADGIVLGQPFAGNPSLFQYNLSDLQIDYNKTRTTIIGRMSQETRVSTPLDIVRAARLNNETESRVTIIIPQNRVLKL